MPKHSKLATLEIQLSVAKSRLKTATEAADKAQTDLIAAMKWLAGTKVNFDRAVEDAKQA